MPHSESENHKPHSTSIDRRGPITSGFQPLVFYRWATLLSITHYRHLTFHRCKQGIHVRVSIMQLSSIELLYLSAWPLHKIKIIKQILRWRIMQLVPALLGRGKVSLSEAWWVLSPKSSLITSGIRTYMQWHAWVFTLSNKEKKVKLNKASITLLSCLKR
jgi:hypothetical protein